MGNWDVTNHTNNTDAESSNSENPNKCGDTISRQAAYDLMRSLTRWCVRSEDGKFNNVGLLYDDVMFGIDKLPSVNPKPCDDAISRQAAIAALKKNFSDDGMIETECGSYWHHGHVIDVLQGMPPVTPMQRTGHWIIISPTDMYCSECNEIEHLDTSRKFCAYCGTKMSENPTGLESEEQA